MPVKGQHQGESFVFEVPLDASGIQDFKPEQALKVVARDQKGALHSETVKLDARGHGAATFAFPENPGALHVLVGPANASDEELTGLQTLTVDVATARWAGRREFVLPAIKIPPYYWHWWLWWCREFIIRGRLVCADGRPVPGAEVCASDVDWWFFWSSTQQVGCATTDANGAFEIRFRWCCGWWHWWWWRHRVWQFDPILSERIRPVLQRNPKLRLSRAGNQPSLGVFKDLLAAEGGAPSRPLADDVDKLEQMRGRLLEKLPVAPELEALRIWPWWPWGPWWDCNPDIIFRATQNCLQPGTVVLSEGVGDTRWNIPTVLNVTLVANEHACCVPQCTEPPCPDGECLVFERICGDPVDEIGGNTGAPASPVGYLHPGAVTPGTAAYDGDRPYAGVIPVEKNFGDMLNVDYYEIEYNAGSGWNPLPAGAVVSFTRRWLETGSWTTGDVGFAFTTISGHTVVESRERFEALGGLGGWDVTRFWLVNRDLVVPLDTTRFPDGTYHFRVVGWQVDGGGNLINPRVLHVCGTQVDNDFVLTFDNRLDPDPAHPTSLTHPCGPGTVHLCVTEPDTDFISVSINGRPVGPCDVVDRDPNATLEIDFLAHDPDGHLAVYSLVATYAENLVRDLLAQPGAVLTALSPMTQVGPTYGQALGQGAAAPTWNGGTYRLTVPVGQAFPEPCCYQLELRAWKRTVVGGQSGVVFFCEHGFAHSNLSEYTIGVGVCPPPDRGQELRAGEARVLEATVVRP